MTVSIVRQPPFESRVLLVPNMDSLQQSYLLRFKEATIRFRTGMPDHSDLAERPDTWDYSVYGRRKAEEVACQKQKE